jgi:hypothetical protein
MTAGAVTLGLVFIAFLFYVIFLVIGCVHTFLQAYALYFLGGRYPLLGDLLEPQATDFIHAEPPLPNIPPALL